MSMLRTWRAAILMQRAARVNSKAFRPGTPATHLIPEFLFDKIHDHGFEQPCGNSERAQNKSRLQKRVLGFGPAFGVDINFFLPSHDRGHEQTNCNCANNPRNRLLSDRAPNFSWQIGFFPDALQPESEIFAGSIDLRLQLRV